MKRGLAKLLAVVPLLLGTAGRARADDTPMSTADRLVNIDTAAVAPRGALAGSVDVRFPVQLENIVYSSVIARYGLTSHLELGVRAETATTTTFTPTGGGSAIGHGGRDVEAYAKVGLRGPGRVRLGLLGGVAFPATAAQHQAVGTVSGTAELPVGSRITLYANPRAAFVKSNSIVGVGLGASIRIGDRIQLIGDWTGIASGNNTVSTVDASLKHKGVWGVALRFTTGAEQSRFDLDLGYTNGTGTTTGTSLTPALGDSAGFYFALRARP